MTAAKTAAQRGRASRAKGAKFERDIAKAIRPWFPDARRSRDNGSSNTSDTGDIAMAGPDLYWSLKDDDKGLTSPPGLIAAWMAEARAKAGGRVPLLVQKRRGHADPLMSWCWLELDALVSLRFRLRGATPDTYPSVMLAPVRLEFAPVLQMLTDAGLANDPRLLEVAS